MQFLKIHINEDNNIDDIELIINCKKTDEKVLKIVAMLSMLDKKITGFKNNLTYILDVSKIFITFCAIGAWTYK